jgi:CBS domain-containing protein
LKFTKRQEEIINIVKVEQPITSEAIAEKLGVTRAALRADLAILTMTDTLDARPKVGYFYSGISNVNLLGDNVNNKLVEDIMSMPIVVKKDTNVYDTIVNIFLADVGSIFIIDDSEELCGIVSRKDLLKATIGGGDINKIPVGMIMTRTPNVVTASKDDTVIQAAKKIIEHEVDSMPVVEATTEGDKIINKVIGRISKTNITKLFLEMVDN